jgi:hypothetical protein
MLVQDGFLYLIVTRHKLTVWHTSPVPSYIHVNIHKMEIFEERSGIFNGRFLFMVGYRLPEGIRLKTEPNYTGLSQLNGS